jgi:hypothetical protein
MSTGAVVILTWLDAQFHHSAAGSQQLIEATFASDHQHHGSVSPPRLIPVRSEL